MGKVFKIAAPIIGAAIAGPVGAAIGGAAAGAMGGGGLKGAAIGAATGYAGSAIGGSISGSLAGGLGKVGSTSLGSLASKAGTYGPFTLGNLGSGAANAVGNTLANTTLSSALGSYAGNSIAGGLAETLMPQKQAAPVSEGPTPFNPSRQAQISLPGSISGLSGLDEGQQSSNLANQGVYGGGNGPQEQSYFTNLINRKLVDDSGRVDEDFSDINPIESSYLSQLGLGGNSNPRSLLEALSKWKAV